MRPASFPVLLALSQRRPSRLTCHLKRTGPTGGARSPCRKAPAVGFLWSTTVRPHRPVDQRCLAEHYCSRASDRAIASLGPRARSRTAAPLRPIEWRAYPPCRPWRRRDRAGRPSPEARARLQHRRPHDGVAPCPSSFRQSRSPGLKGCLPLGCPSLTSEKGGGCVKTLRF